jgi:hypothetical protein
LAAEDGVYRGDYSSLSLESLTAFFVFDVALPHVPAGCRFVRRAQLVNVPAGRREALVRSMLNTPSRVLQYLLFLLSGHDGTEPMEASVRDLHDRDRVSSSSGGLLESSALLEAVARALSRNPAQLDEIERLVTELRTGEAEDLLPPGFDSVWEPAMEARRRLRGATG